MIRRLLLAAAVVLGLILGALLIVGFRIGSWFDGTDPETVASSTLQSVREQNRLTTFEARYVAVVTSVQSRFGLSARKTLILPGTVRYEVDLGRLQQRDLRWDEESETLSISLPPLEISGPDINFGQVQEYGGGGVLTAFTNAEEALDRANRERAHGELLRQAREPVPMRLARESAKRAVARSFAMPLRAAGIEANVAVRFRDEPAQEPSWLDRSRRPEDVLKENRERRESGAQRGQ